MSFPPRVLAPGGTETLESEEDQLKVPQRTSGMLNISLGFRSYDVTFCFIIESRSH